VEMRKNGFRAVSLSVVGAVLLAGAPLSAQTSVRSGDRDRARAMLRNIKRELQKNYYDPAFHGLDLEARFLKAEEKLATATSLGQLMGVIAQAVIDLQDSHTWFMPPNRTVSVDYGWRIQMVGDRCLVTRVKPDSDAQAQGVRPGDVVLEAQGVQPTRENLWKFFYLYERLRPQPALTIVAQSPGQAPRRVQFNARVKEEKRVLDFTGGEDFWSEVRQWEGRERVHQFQELGDVAIWKMPAFDLEHGQVDRFMDKARKHKALVLDLRGNGGGSVDTLGWVVASLFDRDVKIADLKGRRELKAQTAKRCGHAFAGAVVALVDSQSGSAAEVLARVLQIEKRGQVMGDRSAGAVMRSRFYWYELGLDRVIPYGMAITDADVIMTDGQSLERVGVTPDVALLPTPEDVAAGRDPVLARAVELAGGKLDAVMAGRLFAKEGK
jgi:C-terminal processing protease CtpA/Prc